MTFEFNRKDHRYTVDGRDVISNTDVLARVGFVDYSMLPPDRREEALRRGTLVHEATAMLDKGQRWKDREWPPYMQFYVKAWMAAKKEIKFRPIVIEEPFIDPVYHAATCPDRFGWSKFGWTTIQLKTGPVDDWVALQTAFEERCVVLNLDNQALRELVCALTSSPNRFGIELRPDGTYKITRFEDPMDIRVFLGVLGGERWKIAHGYK